MAIKLDLHVTIDGVTTSYKINPPEWVKWERHTGKSITQAADSLGMDDLVFLAYHAMKRSNTEGGTPPMDVWMETIEDIGGGKASDPLATAQTA